MAAYQKYILEIGGNVLVEQTEGNNNSLILKISAKPQQIVAGAKAAEPPVPEGYRKVDVGSQEEFVIERISDGSRFVWIPAEKLDADGTLDGVNFVEKFGRRNFQSHPFSNVGFHEQLEGDLAEQVRSIRKYGGFYYSAFNISKSEAGNPVSVQGAEPWTNLTYAKARQIAASFEDSESVSSHLPFGAEYDTVLAWFVQSGAKTLAQVARDSSNWGNHWDTLDGHRYITKTGSREAWAVHQIYDQAGNVDEWTQERHGESGHVCRGSSYMDEGKYYPVAFRHYTGLNSNSENTGFRIALCLK
ncbi:MAG: hypothetical protein IJV59_04870 [Eubacterium sp.]|nr:hypothetical protein [Eubacterium sp.]